MYIPFDQLSDEARIWIYPANRFLERIEQEIILKESHAFLAQWDTHGQPLQCSAKVFYNQFLILAVEESFQPVSGCAIDASVQFVRTLAQSFQIDFLNKTLIIFRYNGANFMVPLDQLTKKIQQGVVSEDTFTFDNTILTKKDLSDKWLIRARMSWLGKYFCGQSR